MLKSRERDNNLLFKVGLLVSFILILYIFNIWGYDLWSPDEPRYAEVAREMLAEGNWVIPHLNNGVYYQKPPLFFATMAGVSALFGKVTPLTVRLPVIILASLLVGGVAYYTSKRLGSKAGVLTGLILATTGEYFWFGMRVNLDIPLIFCTTLASFLLYNTLHQRDSSNTNSYLAFILMALASLIKSPVALLPVVVIIIYAVLTGQFNKLKRIAWLKGFIAYLAVVGIWVGLAINAAGYDYFKVTVLDQLVGYSTGAQGHSRPFYYYLVNFPLQALPWSLFLIPAFYYYWKKRGPAPELVRFSLIWFLSIFIILSCVGSKRGLYLLQIYPAAAILLGWYCKEHFTWSIESARGLQLSNLILGLFFLLVGGFIKIKGVALAGEELEFALAKHPDLILTIKSLAWFLIIIGLALASSILHRKKEVIVGITALFSIGLILLLKVQVMPAVNPIKSERFLAEDLAELRVEQEPVLLWGSRNRDSGFIFYNGIYYDDILDTAQEVKHRLQQQGSELLIATDADKFNNNFDQLDTSDWVVKEYQVGSDRMLLVKTAEE